jgi:hypothetical protein
MSVNASVLSAEQRNYLISRLSEITSEKVKAKAVALYGPAGRPESPTWGTVFAAIKAGEITLKEGTEDSTNPYLNPTDVVWPAMEAKKQELADYKAMLATEKQRLLDSIWLDTATASALVAFEQL